MIDVDFQNIAPHRILLKRHKDLFTLHVVFGTTQKLNSYLAFVYRKNSIDLFGFSVNSHFIAIAPQKQLFILWSKNIQRLAKWDESFMDYF